MEKASRNDLCFQDQYKLLQRQELTGKSGCALADEFNISKNQVCRIIKNKDKIKEDFESTGNINQCREYTYINSQLNNILNRWFTKKGN